MRKIKKIMAKSSTVLTIGTIRSSPIDAVYRTYGAFSNTGSTVKISAIVGEGVQPGGGAGAAAAQGGGPTDLASAVAALVQASATLQQLLAAGGPPQ